MIDGNLLQTLIANGLRERVILRVDGGFKSGVDVLMAAVMGADEYGFGSVAMIATGCVMARICHTNNCPVGVASQVRKKTLLFYYVFFLIFFFFGNCSDLHYLFFFPHFVFREKNCVHDFLVCLVILLIFSFM